MQTNMDFNFSRDYQNFRPVPRELITQDLVWVSPDADLAEAARLMKENQIGDVLVAHLQDGKLKPLGIVTDRDVSMESVAEEVPFDQLRVADIMTENLTCAPVESGFFEWIRTMKENGITRLPLVDSEGSIVGIVTARKLLCHLVQGLHDLTHISDQQRMNH